MFGRMDSRDKASILNCERKRNRRIVDAVIANHFEMLIGDMDDETLNEFNRRNGFDNEFVVFVPVVMESDMRAGVRINTGGGDNRSAEVAANVLGNDRGIAVVGLGVDIEAFAMIAVNSRFNFFERRTEFGMETIEKGSAERLAQESIVKVYNAFPRRDTPNGNLRDKDMDMRIPLKAATKGMKNTDKTGSEALGFIKFAEHAKDNVADRMKKTIEQGTISAKEDAKFFRNSKDTMPVNALNDLERHGSGTLDGIEITAGGTETAFAAKGNKFECTTRSTPIHSSAKGGIAAVNHLLDVFKNNRASFKGVLDFLIVI